MKKYFGPSTVITAAFIGPGTVTVCTLAGVNSGYELLWALLFSAFATFLLQEMTARLGLISGAGFGEAIRQQLQHPVARLLGITLVLSAIVVGNAAYEGGNISGAALGVQELVFDFRLQLGAWQLSVAPLLIGAIAYLILGLGGIRLVQNALIGLVALMSIVFLTTALAAQPDWSQVIAGLFVPRSIDADWLAVVALIGTTVVPYNLFLHASLVRERYSDAAQLPDLRRELLVSIVIGAAISMSIVITSAATLFGQQDINSAADMAVQLEPLLGEWSTSFLALGLFAAGISSAITAPLAAAYAARGVLGWQADPTDLRFRRVWRGILLIGVAVSASGYSPVLIIQFAQLTNGILLPLVAIFLLVIMNQQSLLKEHTNTTVQNGFGVMIVLVTLLLGFRSLNAVLNFL